MHAKGNTNYSVLFCSVLFRKFFTNTYNTKGIQGGKTFNSLACVVLIECVEGDGVLEWGIYSVSVCMCVGSGQPT